MKKGLEVSEKLEDKEDLQEDSERFRRRRTWYSNIGEANEVCLVGCNLRRLLSSINVEF